MQMSNCRISSKSSRILGVRDFLFDRNSPKKKKCTDRQSISRLIYCFNFVLYKVELNNDKTHLLELILSGKDYLN